MFSYLSSPAVTLLVKTTISSFLNNLNNLIICLSASVFTSCPFKRPPGGHRLFLENKYDHVLLLLKNLYCNFCFQTFWSKLYQTFLSAIKKA